MKSAILCPICHEPLVLKDNPYTAMFFSTWMCDSYDYVMHADDEVMEIIGTEIHYNKNAFIYSNFNSVNYKPNIHRVIGDYYKNPIQLDESFNPSPSNKNMRADLDRVLKLMMFT